MKKIALLFLLLALRNFAYASSKLKVITTISILEDMAKNVGGNKVEVTSLVGFDGDAHVYEPSPKDIKKVSQADVIITNGLGFEGWLSRITQQAEFRGIVVVAASGIQPIGKERDEDHSTGTVDPHGWHDVSNAIIYVENIAKGFESADRKNKKYYEDESKKYISKLKALDAEIKAKFKKIPKEKRKVITSHDAFGYYAKGYGLQFLSPQGVSTESEASAKDVATLIRLIKSENIKAVFVENVTDPRLISQISKEGGVKLGGKLYSDALSKNKEAATYIHMMKSNTSKILKELK